MKSRDDLQRRSLLTNPTFTLPLGSATVRAPGVCGELVQGMLEDVYFLVTCPIDFFARVKVELFQEGPREGPNVEAPSEGEAQAAYMVKSGKAFAVASQDADSLIFGAPKLLRNLSISGRRKKGKSISYEIIKPELLDLSENLNNLGIDQNQLIALAMIIGTDYNPGGIKGIGPKNALKLVKQHKDFDSLFKKIKWNDYFDFPWTEVYYLIKKIPTTDNYKLKWNNIENERLYNLLVDKHDFSEQRVANTLEKLKKETSKKQQKSLGDF